MSNEYFGLLQRPEWQKKRLERLEIAGWECENCGSKENQLHVHHKQYFKGRKPWEYENDQLEVLCHECHDLNHAAIQSTKEILSLSDNIEIFNILFGYADTSVIEKLTDAPYNVYSYEYQAVGYMARLLTFIDSRKYRKICEFLIANANDEEEATNFFRQKYDNGLEEE